MNNNIQGQKGIGGELGNDNAQDQNRAVSRDRGSESQTLQDIGSLTSSEDLILVDPLKLSPTNIGVKQENGNATHQNLYDSNQGESVSHASPDSSEALISSGALVLADKLTAILSSINVPHTRIGDSIHVDPRYKNLIFRILCVEKRSDIYPIYKLKKIHRHRPLRGEENNLYLQKGRYPIVYPPIHIGDRSSKWLFRLRSLRERVES